MRGIRRVVPAYVLAICAVVFPLLADHLDVARWCALLPFAVLMLAIAHDRDGWIAAVGGLLVTCLAVLALASKPGDWIAAVAIPAGSLLLTVALLRSGGWQAIRRHRWITATVAVVPALLLCGALIAVVVALPQAFRPQCVDSCFGPAVVVFLSLVLIGEVLAFALAAAAAARSRVTGLGALVLAIGENLLLFLAPPANTASYAAAIVTWYLGLFAVTLPWTRELRRPEPQPA
jgi:hypothetical protein